MLRGTLRIATAGSVDDGKSTLIGRLLHDTKTVFEDQLRAVEKASSRYGDGATNLALLTDGLRAEREQGITIDVAHRYFTTERRSFIVADTPGHAQYTRNMVTGASTSDVAIVLVDARHGVVDQTRRHALIAALLRVEAIVVAVNKMDLVDWDEGTYLRIAKEVQAFVDTLPHRTAVTAIPLCALDGDNVVLPGRRSPWYSGPTLLGFLEDFDGSVEVADGATQGATVHVQRVIRPQGGEHADFRGYAGTVAGGPLRLGDAITVLPSGQRSTVAGLQRWGVDIVTAQAGQAVVVRLTDDVDVARGDVVSARHEPPAVTEHVVVDVCWMIDRPLVPGSRWLFKHGTRTGPVIVEAIEFAYHLETLDREQVGELRLNDIGRVHLALGEPIVADRYHDHGPGGRMLVVDPATNTTAGAAMIERIGQ